MYLVAPPRTSSYPPSWGSCSCVDGTAPAPYAMLLCVNIWTYRYYSPSPLQLQVGRGTASCFPRCNFFLGFFLTTAAVECLLFATIAAGLYFVSLWSHGLHKLDTLHCPHAWPAITSTETKRFSPPPSPGTTIQRSPWSFHKSYWKQTVVNQRPHLQNTLDAKSVAAFQLNSVSCIFCNHNILGLDIHQAQINAQ